MPCAPRLARLLARSLPPSLPKQRAILYAIGIAGKGSLNPEILALIKKHNKCENLYPHTDDQTREMRLS